MGSFLDYNGRLSSARDGRHTVVDEPTRELGNPGPHHAEAMRRT